MMYKKVLLFVFFLALSCGLIGAQQQSLGVSESSASPSGVSFIAPTPAASGGAAISGGSASNQPVNSVELSPSSPNTVNLTTETPFTPTASSLPGSATTLSTPIFSTTAPTAISPNPSASPLGSGASTAASNGASNSESAASASSNAAASASTGASIVVASNSGSAASASGAAGVSSSGSAASATTAASIVASNSPAAAASPSYGCYCDWYEIPTIQKVPNTNSSFDYPNYAPGTLYYGQQLSNTLNYMVVASTQAQGGSGIVDVFTRFANFPYWTYRTTLYPSSTNTTHYFGSYLSILNDANVVVIETNPRPRFYSFERSGPGSWIQIQPNFLLNVARVTAMDARGSLMVVAYRVGTTGAVAIYNKIGYTWTLVTNITNPEGGNIFYSSVSIGAGNIFAAVTSNTQGSVHVFTRTNLGVWNAPQPVSMNATSGQAYFGVQLRTVAVSPDRSAIAVGSANTIWIMSAFGNRTFPADINQVTGFDSEANSAQFTNVFNIKLAGNIMVVADNQIPPASLANTACTPSGTTGAIFVYQRNGVQASPSSVFRPSSVDDAFGNSLSISTTQGNIIIAGGSVDTVYTFVEQGDVAIPQACTGYGYEGK